MDVAIDPERISELLGHLGKAGPMGRPKADLERELSPELIDQMKIATRFGLARPIAGDSIGLSPAGRQYLESDGAFDQADLAILPTHLDNLIARRALREASRKVIRDLERDLIDQIPPERVRRVAPQIFVGKIDQATAIRLYAAANSLVTRLLHDDPPGSPAERIVGAMITETAKELLASKWGNQFAEEDLAEALFTASGAIVTLIPADLADRFVASSSTSPLDLFRPFVGVPPIGYLDR